MTRRSLLAAAPMMAAPLVAAGLAPERTLGAEVPVNASKSDKFAPIAVYAAICRELGLPFSFPGKPGAWTALYEVTDARILAHTAECASTSPRCAGEAFNITNGDHFRWCNVWPAFAAHFGLELGEPRHLSLTEFMADKGPLWDAIVERHGLLPYQDEEIASWAFGDTIFGWDWDGARSTLKYRAYGFEGFIDSQQVFTSLFDELAERRDIPAPSASETAPAR